MGAKLPRQGAVEMEEKTRQVQFSAREGFYPYAVQAEARMVGEDLLVIVSGGEKPHVGAVAIAVPRPSLEDPQAVSATASVFALIGHKEDELARKIALELAAALRRHTVVTAGIHVDKISPAGIKKIEENCSAVLERLKRALEPLNGKGADAHAPQT